MPCVESAGYQDPWFPGSTNVYLDRDADPLATPFPCLRIEPVASLWFVVAFVSFHLRRGSNNDPCSENIVEGMVAPRVGLRNHLGLYFTL